MTRLWSYMIRYRGRYALGIACLIATGTLAMLIPFMLKHAVDAIAAGGGVESVSWLAVGIIVIAVLQGVVRTFSRFVIFNVGRDIEYDLRNDLFEHLERLPLSYYQGQQTGDLMSRLVNDITAIRLLLGIGLLNMINTPIYYVYGVSIMVSLDWRLTIASLVTYPIALLFVKRTSRQLMERTLKVQEGLAAMSARVQESLSGIQALQAYVREQSESAAFRRLNDEFSQQSLGLARVRGTIMPVMRAVSTFGTLVVLWYGGMRVIGGALSLGDLVAFMGYLHLLAWPTMALGWMLSIVQRGRAALRRLEVVFAVEPTIDDRHAHANGHTLRGEVVFRDVGFAHESARNGSRILADVSFTVPAGSTLAIVGRTGAGKSSIVNLIPRLYDPVEGTITIDGRDLREIPLGVLRRSIGFVPQDPYLFSRTLRDNIRFGAPDASEVAIARAVEAAGLERDLDDLPRGYETVVGERGITLSGGQKQRTTLARALLVDPTILILDDALSSVDTETERRILGHLRGLMRDRTSILIAHRISTVMDADLILVVDAGRIVEAGDHAALLARGGFYADLFQRQRLTEELEAL
jgi:ATP-binding cassette subfamily B protein